MQNWHLLTDTVMGQSFIKGSDLLCANPPTTDATLRLEFLEESQPTYFTVTADNAVVTGSANSSQYEYKIHFRFTRHYDGKSYLTGIITRRRLEVEDPDDMESATGITDPPPEKPRRTWRSRCSRLFARRR